MPYTYIAQTKNNKRIGIADKKEDLPNRILFATEGNKMEQIMDFGIHNFLRSLSVMLKEGSP